MRIPLDMGVEYLYDIDTEEVVFWITVATIGLFLQGPLVFLGRLTGFWNDGIAFLLAFLSALLICVNWNKWQGIFVVLPKKITAWLNQKAIWARWLSREERAGRYLDFSNLGR